MCSLKQSAIIAYGSDLFRSTMCTAKSLRSSNYCKIHVSIFQVTLEGKIFEMLLCEALRKCTIEMNRKIKANLLCSSRAGSYLLYCANIHVL